MALTASSKEILGIQPGALTRRPVISVLSSQSLPADFLISANAPPAQELPPPSIIPVTRPRKNQLKTLLVIDMQNAWLNRETPRFDRDGVIERINKVARHMRAQGSQVIFIQHCDSDVLPSQDGWKLDTGLEVLEDDRKIDKTACDAFADTVLFDLLLERDSKTVIIAGLATEFCVDTTVRAALSMGFDVIALSDAHTTGDRAHLSAHQIIEHHNWVWANLAVPIGSTLTVQTTQQMLDAETGL